MTPTKLYRRIINQNYRLHNSSFHIDQIYPAAIPRDNNNSLTITCDLHTQRQIIPRCSIIYEDSECEAYEYVNILQCFKCQSFGHTSMNCYKTLTCKICAQHHHHTQCTTPSEHTACSNCIYSNEKGFNFETGHRSAYGRCQTKQRIIEQDIMQHLRYIHHGNLAAKILPEDTYNEFSHVNNNEVSILQKSSIIAYQDDPIPGDSENKTDDAQ